MRNEDGFFFPDDFPTPFDAAFATLHKAAALNGVPAKPIVRALGFKAKHRSHTLTVTPASLQLMYGADRPFLAATHFLDLVDAFLPAGVRGQPKFCPGCAADSGYVSVFFQLKCVRWCPWHRQALLPLCARCVSAVDFKPDHGLLDEAYLCPDCGYRVPSIKVIMASLRSGLCAARVASSTQFLRSLARWQRLGVLDELDVDGPENDRLPESDGCYEAFVDDPSMGLYRCTIDLREPAIPPLPPGRYTTVYRQLIHFMQERLLGPHRTCLLNAQASAKNEERPCCLFAATLQLFRTKFEAAPSLRQEPQLRDEAIEALSALGFTDVSLRRYFRVTYYQLLSRMWYRVRYTRSFGVLFRPDYYYAVFQPPLPSLDIYLGRSIRGQVHSIKLDLPKGLAAFRRVLQHDDAAATFYLCRDQVRTLNVNHRFFGAYGGGLHFMY